MKQIVFPQLVDYAAFVDTIVLSVFGVRRKRPVCAVRLGRNLPIAGGRSLYARVQEGICTDSGNPFGLKYGRLQSQFAPPFRLTIRSESSALTACAVERVVAGLFRRGTRYQVSLIEATLDTTTSLDFFRKHARYRLRQVKHGPSLYMFSPASAWQVRIYAKTQSTTRMEFILRRSFLRRIAIEQTADVARIRRLALFDRFPLREVRSRVRTLNGSLTMFQLRTHCARKRLRVEHFVRACPEERVMKAMLRRLVW